VTRPHRAHGLHQGKFINADLDKASEDNERNSLVLIYPRGRIGVVQIAGLIARRSSPSCVKAKPSARATVSA